MQLDDQDGMLLVRLRLYPVASRAEANERFGDGLDSLYRKRLVLDFALTKVGREVADGLLFLRLHKMQINPGCLTCGQRHRCAHAAQAGPLSTALDDRLALLRHLTREVPREDRARVAQELRVALLRLEEGP